MKTVLGIDPGISILGFGVMQIAQQRIALLDSGILRLASKDPIEKRILVIHDFLVEKILTYKISDLALETPFLGKNAQNFLKLGYVRGILYLLAAQRSLIIHEFSPREIKAAITGFGGAEKEQVARVIMRLFPGLACPERFDSTDALSVALCAAWKR